MKTNISFDQMQTLANLLDTGVDLKDSTINGHINELTQSLANLAIMRAYRTPLPIHSYRSGKYRPNICSLPNASSEECLSLYL